MTNLSIKYLFICKLITEVINFLLIYSLSLSLSTPVVSRAAGANPRLPYSRVSLSTQLNHSPHATHPRKIQLHIHPLCLLRSQISLPFSQNPGTSRKFGDGNSRYLKIVPGFEGWARHSNPHHQKSRFPRNVEAIFPAIPSDHSPRRRSLKNHQSSRGFWLWTLQ